MKIQNSVVFVKKKLKINILKIKGKFRDHCHNTDEYRDAAHDICNLMYSKPTKIPVVFHNGSSHDYDFIIK